MEKESRKEKRDRIGDILQANTNKNEGRKVRKQEKNRGKVEEEEEGKMKGRKDGQEKRKMKREKTTTTGEMENEKKG